MAIFYVFMLLVGWE